MNELLDNSKFQDNYLNFDNIPIRENLFQNTEKEYEKKEKSIKKSYQNKPNIELFTEFYQRAQAYNQANKFANILSKDLNQPILIKENFFNSTKLTQNEINKSQLNELLDYKILKDIILSVGYYTPNIRFTIWKFLLSHNGNDKLYKIYLKKGTHMFFENLDKILPVKNKVLGCRLKSTCSILAHWSPQIGISYFLPNLVFPFVKCIRGEEPFLIDVLVSFITYWCQYWFELYPELPITHLKIVEKILENENPSLLNHICRISFVGKICWEFMKNLYSENLEKEKWLQLLDFLITFNHRPEYLIYFNAVYLINQENVLKNCKNSSDLDKFVYSIHNVNMLKLINQTISIVKKYSQLNNQIYKPYTPLQENYYPVVHFSQLLEYLKTVTDLNSNMKTGKEENKKLNKSKSKSKKQVKENEYIKEKETTKLKKNSSKGRFKLVNDIRQKINHSNEQIQKEENALHNIEKLIHQKEFQQKINSIDMDNEQYIEEKSKMRKEMRNIENDKANHLARIKELECKIDELQKNVNYYKQLSEPILDGDKNFLNQDDSIDENSLEKPIIKSKNFTRANDIKNSLQISVNSQSLGENEQMRSYNLSNSAQSNNWKNDDQNLVNNNNNIHLKSKVLEIPTLQTLTQNSNSFKAQNSKMYNNLLLSSNSGSVDQMKNEISPNNEEYIKEINEYQHQDENNVSSKRNHTPHFDYSQNKNNQSNRSNRLINSKNSQGLVSLNSLSLSDSNSSNVYRNLEN